MTRWEALVTMCRILDLNKFPYTQQQHTTKAAAEAETAAMWNHVT